MPVLSWNFQSHSLSSLPLPVSQLHEASYSRRPDIIHQILSVCDDRSRQVMIRSTDPQTGNTPLMWACMAGCIASVSLLLRCGSEVTSINFENRNPLHLAVSSGNVPLVEKLISWRSLCLLGDSQGATPLHYAAVSSVDMVRVFVEVGISFLVRDHDEDLPLHWACRESSIKNVREICSQEPFLATVPNQYGETPLQLAQHYEEKEILTFFYHENPGTATAPTDTPTFLIFTPGKANSSEVGHKEAFSNIWGFSPQVPPQQGC